MRWGHHQPWKGRGPFIGHLLVRQGEAGDWHHVQCHSSQVPTRGGWAELGDPRTLQLQDRPQEARGLLSQQQSWASTGVWGVPPGTSLIKGQFWQVQRPVGSAAVPQVRPPGSRSRQSQAARGAPYKLPIDASPSAMSGPPQALGMGDKGGPPGTAPVPATQTLCSLHSQGLRCPWPWHSPGHPCLRRDPAPNPALSASQVRGSHTAAPSPSQRNPQPAQMRVPGRHSLPGHRPHRLHRPHAPPLAPHAPAWVGGGAPGSAHHPAAAPGLGLHPPSAQGGRSRHGPWPGSEGGVHRAGWPAATSPACIPQQYAQGAGAQPAPGGAPAA